MTALICGSLAFDTVMVFQGRFREQILADRIHMLNVSFLVPSMRRNFGGCAGNIAYNLMLLGEKGAPMGTVGHDFEPYRRWLKASNVSLDYVRELNDAFTAQAFITTDLDDNQITAFHPGAMGQSHESRVSDVDGVRLGIVAPDGRDGMLKHAAEFRAARIPFVLDPGQAMTLFSGDELVDMVDAATVVAVNDYEARLLSERTGLAIEEIARRVEALVVTLGAEGSRIHVGGATIHVPVVRARALVDPTGCGDAHRAGLLYGMAQGWDWQRTGRLSSLLGSIKIAARGGQNHALDRDLVARLYAKEFGSDPW